jgi:hypothetical protein
MVGAAKGQKNRPNPTKSDQIRPKRKYREKERMKNDEKAKPGFGMAPPPKAGQNEVKLTLPNLTGFDLI